MKTIQLSDKVVKVSLHHLEDVVDVGEGPERRRLTDAVLHDANGDTLLVGTAICHPRDNFSRKLGRKIAADNLLGAMRDSYVVNRWFYEEWLRAKGDRREVFFALCPEFRKGKKDGRANIEDPKV